MAEVSEISSKEEKNESCGAINTLEASSTRKGAYGKEKSPRKKIVPEYGKENTPERLLTDETQLKPSQVAVEKTREQFTFPDEVWTYKKVTGKTPCDPDLHGPDKTISGLFKDVPFAEGRYRVVLKGIYTDPPFKCGHLCVLKEERDTKFWAGHTKSSLEVHRIAKSLAEEFNKENMSPRKLEFVDIADCYEVKILGAKDAKEGTNLAVIIEDFIHGDFEKWSNNYGYISGCSNTIAAFMHWTFIKTEGKMMVADMQGVKTGSTYILTDPAILSNTTDHIYGKSDTGAEGMALFFANHHCSWMCIDLPKPTLDDIYSILPPKVQDRAEQIKKSTALIHELVTPMDALQLLIQLLSIVAKQKHRKIEYSC